MIQGEISDSHPIVDSERKKELDESTPDVLGDSLPAFVEPEKKSVDDDYE